MAEIFNGSSNAQSSVGTKDVTQFAGIWGRNYTLPGYPIVAQWPGVGNQLVAPKFGVNQYIAAKFSTTGGQHGHKLLPEGSSFAFSGGGTGNRALLSATVSTVCGDFDKNSSNIPPNCAFSQMQAGRGGARDAVQIYTNQPVNPNYCVLQNNTEYYLNLIYAPLTSPATAVFNGLSGDGVVLLQNLQVN